MAERPSALQESEVKGFLDASRLVIEQALTDTSRGRALLTSPLGGGERFIDIRTLAAAIVTFSELGDFQLARSFSSFLLARQSTSGAWAISLDPNGVERDELTQEDVTAVALWAVMTYVRASGDDSFAEGAREAVEEATRYTRARTLNPYLYLIETTHSLPGPVVSEGYDLWNNCAHAAAFALCHRVYGGERHRRLALLIRRAIGLLLSFEGRFLRRLDPNGNPDVRPDICLMAPNYFGLWAPTERMVMNSAELVERTLWNVETGGYIRVLPYSPVERAALFGPSPCFTAWMARYHYELGNKDRAEAIMRWLFDSTSSDRLAETLVPSASALRYMPELRRSLTERNGHRTLGGRERRGMAKLLDSLERAAGDEDVVACGAPSVWAHLETLRALRRGGYLDTWQVAHAPAQS